MDVVKVKKNKGLRDTRNYYTNWMAFDRLENISL